MKSTFSLDSPDELEATMTITMPMKEWRVLKGALTADVPLARKIIRDINDNQK